MQVVIIDADPQAAAYLRDRLEDLTDSRILCFGKASEALFEIGKKTLRPAVCFIDLTPEAAESEGPEGIALAQLLQELCPGLQIIFTSEYGIFYLDAYEAEPAWFLHKPIDARLLNKAWNRAVQRLDRWESRMFSYQFAKSLYRIPLQEILYFEKDRRKVIIHTKGPEKDPYFYGTMDDVITRLDDSFARCHNSYIVNLRYVSILNKTTLTIGQQKIPVSRQYLKSIRTALTGIE